MSQELAAHEQSFVQILTLIRKGKRQLLQGEDSKGFSASNLWRMKQFFELYAEDHKLARLVRELPWTHNLIIMGRCKSAEWSAQLEDQQETSLEDVA